MPTCPDDNTLAAFVRGKLEREEARGLEHHVDGCTTCAEVVGILGKTFPAEGVSSQASTLGAHADEPPHLLSRGARVGRFIVERLIGAGGMGVVYRAADPELDRAVAVKLLRPELSTEAARARLLREAQAMARLSHPNVIVVYEVGSFRDQTFVAMELVPGQTLREWLGAEKRSWREVLRICAQAGQGLAAAHAAGIVHRDFKPANVLVGQDGRVRVMDFGLARAGSEPSSIETPSLGMLSDEITRAGTLLGTPAYMSPEQKKGLRADERSDQYSFCLTLYEGLYGHRPESTGEARADAPSWLRRVVLRGLSEDPHDRYPSMEALLAALSRPQTRWWAVAVGGLALSAAIAVPAIVSSLEDPCPPATGRLVGVWDAMRRDAVEKAFLATNVTGAAPAFQAAARRLDDYARQWVERRGDACQATWVRREQSERALDERMVCLDQRLRDLRVVVDAAAKADEATVRGFHKLAGALPALDDCNRGLTDPASVVEPSLRAPVAPAETQLTLAKTLSSLGRGTEARGLCQEVVETARRLAVPRLQARALSALGEIVAELGEMSAARQALLAAVAAAEEAHDDVLRAQVWGRLAFLVGNEGRQFEEAHQYCRYAEAALKRAEVAGPLPKMRGRLAHAEALIYMRELRHDEAEPLMRQAVATAEAGGGHDDETARIYSNYGLLLSAKHRWGEAEKVYLQALDILQEIATELHPSVPILWSNIAAARHDRGDLVGALEAARRSLAVREKSVPPGSLVLGTSYYNMAQSLNSTGKRVEARDYLQRAIAIFREKQGEKGTYLGHAYTLLGQILIDENRHADAIEPFEKALAIRQATPTPPAALAATQYGLADALWTTRKDPRARTLLADAKKGFDEAGDPQGKEAVAELAQKMGR